MKTSLKRNLCIAIGLTHCVSAWADDIPLAYTIVSQTYEVPADVLYAIALTESGKAYGKKHVPWPWTLNVSGKGVYCASQAEAKTLLSTQLDEYSSIDVGLMQVNWHWHQQRFNSIDDALMPMKNLAVGAIILREQFERAQDWWQAVGYYHAPGSDQRSINHANAYRERVKKNWERLF